MRHILAVLVVTGVMASSAAAAPRPTPAALTFGSQPVSSISAPQTISVTYDAAAELAVSLAGANGEDFIIERTPCESVTVYDLCASLGVRFVPSAAGPRHAILHLQGDGERDVPLTGTGEARPVPTPVIGPIIEPPTPELITSEIAAQWLWRRRSTRVLQLLVRKVPLGASVQVRCLPRKHKGRRRLCPFNRKGVPILAHRANVRRALPTKTFKVGTTLEIRVVKADAIGKVRRFAIRRSKAPAITRLCLPPRATRPSRC